MKKFLIAVMMLGIICSPLGTEAINRVLPTKYEQVQKVHAKGYRSPSRTFSPGNNGIRKKSNNPSNFNNNQTKTTNKRNSFFGGGRGLLGGLMLGGLAGLLFGGFLGNMGGFGQFLGLAINLLAIYLVIRLVVLFFQRRKQMATSTGPSTGHQNYQTQEPFTETVVKNPVTQQEDEKIILDEGNISNAVISFFSSQKGMALQDIEVILTYDDDEGYSAEVLKDGRMLESLDHFSLVQAIRYWAVEHANLNPNVGIRFQFSELEGIKAILV